MKFIEDFPCSFRHVENEWIPMSDGTNLAARLWIPEMAFTSAVPAILEYIPYRKRDSKRFRDEINHKYFAGHGYACIRVDTRGSGDSDGILTDEYLEQELADGEEILEWIADQDWCDGNVGIIGISWGGFNGLQIAARQPEPLKAIITVCSTDDRYADDVHYMGGCLLGDNLSWASVMFGKNSLPPDPEVVGEKWKDMWLDRLDKSGLWLENWLQHQTRDEYWKHGSINENYDDIQCPVMAVSGWADGYTNAVFRLIENLEVERMGLVGPWSHKYPNMGEPGPAIGFLQESIRWWDQWLKNKDTGIADEPKLKVWMQESVPPATQYDHRPGYWVGMDNWPSEIIETQEYFLGDRELVPAGLSEPLEKTLSICSPVNVGMFSGKWCSYNAPPDLPSDQRQEDGGSLVFETEPLDEDLEILGSPKIKLKIEADKPSAMLAVRLSDIAPDGKATRVTYGVLNLTHYKSHENPEYLEPGKRYEVSLNLNYIAHRFPQDHGIRVSISSSYWPLAWTPPELAELKVHTSMSSFVLPVKVRQGKEITFPPAEGAALSSTKKILHEPDHQWTVQCDLANDKSMLRVLKDDGTYIIDDIDLKVSNYSEEKYIIGDNSPQTARGEVIWKKRLSRDNWEIQTYTKTILTADKQYFYIHAELDAFEGEERVFSRNWQRKIPREFI